MDTAQTTNLQPTGSANIPTQNPQSPFSAAGLQSAGALKHTPDSSNGKLQVLGGTPATDAPAPPYTPQAFDPAPYAWAISIAIILALALLTTLLIRRLKKT